jgi:ABC-type amino acid transport substrate-binding protein
MKRDGLVGFSKKRSRGDLRDEFDKVLLSMKQDGSYDSIINEYFTRK